MNVLPENDCKMDLWQYWNIKKVDVTMHLPFLINEIDKYNLHYTFFLVIDMLP